MPDRRCPEGHLVTDDSALRCPERRCGEWVEGAPPPSATSSTAGLALILAGFAPGVGGVVLFVMALDRSPDTSLPVGLLFVASTLAFLGGAMFLVGCIAEGVRLGNEARRS